MEIRKGEIVDTIQEVQIENATSQLVLMSEYTGKIHVQQTQTGNTILRNYSAKLTVCYIRNNWVSTVRKFLSNERLYIAFNFGQIPLMYSFVICIIY